MRCYALSRSLRPKGRREGLASEGQQPGARDAHGCSEQYSIHAPPDKTARSPDRFRAGATIPKRRCSTRSNRARWLRQRRRIDDEEPAVAGDGSGGTYQNHSRADSRDRTKPAVNARHKRTMVGHYHRRRLHRTGDRRPRLSWSWINAHFTGAHASRLTMRTKLWLLSSHSGKGPMVRIRRPPAESPVSHRK